MKKLLCLCAALAMAFTAAAAMAADLTGTWNGSAETPNGTFQLTFTFKQDGAALTGTVQVPQGDPMPITNGKVDGNKFTFDVAFNGMTIHHDCTVDDNQIQMETKSDSGDFPGMKLTLKRAGAAPEAPHQLRTAQFPSTR
jgi:hypothetical protein